MNITHLFDTKKYGAVERVETFPRGADPHAADETNVYGLQGWGYDVNQIPLPDLGDATANGLAAQIGAKRFRGDSSAEKRQLMERYLAGNFSLNGNSPLQFDHEHFMIPIPGAALSEIVNAVDSARYVRTSLVKEKDASVQNHKDRANMYLMQELPFWRIGSWEYSDHVNLRITKHNKQTDQGEITTYVIEQGWSIANNSGQGGNRQIIEVDHDRIVIEVANNPVQQSRMPYALAVGAAVILAAGLYVGMCNDDTTQKASTNPASLQTIHEPASNLETAIEVGKDVYQTCSSSKTCRDRVGGWLQKAKEAVKKE